MTLDNAVSWMRGEAVNRPFPSERQPPPHFAGRKQGEHCGPNGSPPAHPAACA